MHLGNSGKAAAVFQVRSANDANGPWTYTVAPESHLNPTWGIRVDGARPRFSCHGTNGFFRSFKGSIAGATSEPDDAARELARAGAASHT